MLAFDLDKDFIDEIGIAVASVFSLEAFSVELAKLVTPETDAFVGDSNAAFGKEVFDVTVREVAAVIEP